MAKNNKDAASRETAEIQYTPTQTGTYYIWVEPNPYGYNFAYWLEVSGGGSPEPPDGFPDVPAFHPYHEAITDLASAASSAARPTASSGLMLEVTRQQFAKMIVGTLGISPNASTATRFTDLGSPDAAGYPHIFVQAAYDNGITTGTNLAQTLFAPTNPIHRDQMVSMIVRGAKSIFPGTLENPPTGTPSVFAGVGEPHGANLRIAEYNGLLDGLVGMGSGWRCLCQRHAWRSGPGAVEPTCEDGGLRPGESRTPASLREFSLLDPQRTATPGPAETAWVVVRLIQSGPPLPFYLKSGSYLKTRLNLRYRQTWSCGPPGGPQENYGPHRLGAGPLRGRCMGDQLDSAGCSWLPWIVDCRDHDGGGRLSLWVDPLGNRAGDLRRALRRDRWLRDRSHFCIGLEELSLG